LALPGHGEAVDDEALLRTQTNATVSTADMGCDSSTADGQRSDDRQIATGLRSGLSLQVFVISWSGKHENAALIERCCTAEFPVSVIYSDRDDAVVPNAKWIRVTDDCFFGYKFNRALPEFDGDVIAFITADAQYNDWSGLLKNCQQAFERYKELGVWAPDVDFSPYNHDWNVLAQVAGTNFIKVVQTDSIVWAFSQAVADRLKSLDFRLNNFGWGVDVVASAYCHAMGKLVLVDKGIKVFHPKGTAYSQAEARGQCVEFLRQMSGAELLAWQGIQKVTGYYDYPRVRRNELCLCKSGLRYKHCHGRYYVAPPVGSV
jgi:hypothetical protein